jgi:N-acetylmuramoyl-L-alanine amidase
MFKITIDPGHGGLQKVGGSSANNAIGAEGTLEKDLTLEIGLLLQEYLLGSGHDVLMTRDSDVNLGLKNRANRANDFSSDIFISIHFNGYFDFEVQGTETWVYPDTHTKNRTLATFLQQNLVSVTNYTDRGLKSGKYGVLNPNRHDAKTAVCLVEVSFLTNPEDEQKLQDCVYKDALAKAMYQGVEDYFELTTNLENGISPRMTGSPYMIKKVDVLVEDGDA